MGSKPQHLYVAGLGGRQCDGAGATQSPAPSGVLLGHQSRGWAALRCWGLLVFSGGELCPLMAGAAEIACRQSVRAACISGGGNGSVAVGRRSASVTAGCVNGVFR